MKGIAIIVMLLGLLLTGYLVLQDLKSKQERGTANIEAIEKASQVDRKVQKSFDAQERRIKDIVGE
jgi:hypothetical protein